MIVCMQSVLFLNFAFVSAYSPLAGTLRAACQNLEPASGRSFYCNPELSIDHVPFPLPFNCDGLNVSTSCEQTHDILTEGYKNYVIIYSDSAKCLVKIRLLNVKQIYSVRIREDFITPGPGIVPNVTLTLSKSSILGTDSEEPIRSFPCTLHLTAAKHHFFYCYNHEFPVTSADAMVYNTDTVEITPLPLHKVKGNLHAGIKVFPFPGQLCRKPLDVNLSQNIKIRPFSDFYLPGQTITFECVEQGSSLVGDSVNKCGVNGKWNVEAPTCVRATDVAYAMTISDSEMEAEKKSANISLSVPLTVGVSVTGVVLLLAFTLAFTFLYKRRQWVNIRCNAIARHEKKNKGHNKSLDNTLANAQTTRNNKKNPHIKKDLYQMKSLQPPEIPSSANHDSNLMYVNFENAYSELQPVYLELVT